MRKFCSGLFCRSCYSGGICSPEYRSNVDVKPEVLNLNANGVSTVYITLPEGYSVKDVVVSTVECGGAKAIRGVAADDNVFVAKFNRKDLQPVGVLYQRSIIKLLISLIPIFLAPRKAL